MRTVLSRDGTRIAFDLSGRGDPVILVAGAFSYRKYKGLIELSELLSKHFTVTNYDRRGRGDSGDQPRYAAEREIEDLDALIGEAGGSAYVWGLSSGATLALRAASRGLAIRKLALYEPPFLIDGNGHLPPRDFEKRLRELIASGRRDDAVKYFLVDGMGAPRPAAFAMRWIPGMWRPLRAVAHTLPYDAAVLGGTIRGTPPTADEWADVKVTTLVISGGKSPAVLRRGAEALAKVLPDARLRVLEGQNHRVSMNALAPVLRAFFAK